MPKDKFHQLRELIRPVEAVSGRLETDQSWVCAYCDASLPHLPKRVKEASALAQARAKVTLLRNRRTLSNAGVAGAVRSPPCLVLGLSRSRVYRLCAHLDALEKPQS